MCAVLEISPKTYYKYRNKEDSDYYVNGKIKCRKLVNLNVDFPTSFLMI